jgi:hypothetical protein
MLATDIARLMAQIPKEEQMALEGTNGLAGRAKAEQPSVRGGVFEAEAGLICGIGRLYAMIGFRCFNTIWFRKGRRF